ncbi:MAG TPA: adenylate/guanylate cyclase domain-containing protein [Alphaproteobacteria bacterium]|nr:adenylate/guanylate cyclase domain-containing protein [Alphaproteobacteria bacterium]
MGGVRLRDLIAVVAVALLAGTAAALPALDVLRGVSIDLLTALRWQTYGAMNDPAQSPTVVVALDEETYRTPPFANTPNVTWTREIGKVLTAVLDGGAKVVGFDMILPTSLEQSTIPFGDGTLGERVKGFDRDFLQALAIGARAGKVVLGEVQHADSPVLPFMGQRMAVGPRNIRSLNLFVDADEIVRRVPLTFLVDGAPQPSMSVELAARATGKPAERSGDGTLVLDGYRVPSRVPDTLALNFEGGADDIPTYSLADLRACTDKGDRDFFRRNFAGRVVLVGAVLDVEDRRLTSKRFATGIEGARAPRCVLPAPASFGAFARDSISGVYIHATAVNDLLRHAALRELGRPALWSIDVAAAFLCAAAALLLSPLRGLLAFAVLAAGWAAGATWAFAQALVLPLVDPLLAGLAAGAATVAYRFVVADQEKRLLRRGFALYLAPAVIDRMLASDKLPQLGGETREITVYFSDVAGFSSISEKLEPDALVELMNEYLSAMTDIIEAHGGFVDKYIGDAIVAVFGAPLNDPQHALNAVRAALACQRRLAELNRESPKFRGFKLGQRIGLNSGDALVGNIGSRRRFNYTVMGDSVNLASRLEGANKFFGTSIIAAESTARQAGATILWRELDQIRVKGRETPVKILEPLGTAEAPDMGRTAAAMDYAEGLACWRARDFAGAVQYFERSADRDPPSARFLERARHCAAAPPGPAWEPVNTLEEK